MPRRTLLIPAAILVLGVLVAGGLYLRWYYSPRYALQQMVLALQTRNMDNFFKYLDLKAVFDNYLEASSKDLPPAEDPKADDWTRFSQRLSRKFARQLLPKLFETFEQQIRTVVEQYLLKLETSKIMALGAAATVAQIDTEGEEALVTLFDPKTGEPFRFQMRRNPDTGVWRIVSVNYQDLKKFLKREFQK
jgi:hypothetical protein